MSDYYEDTYFDLREGQDDRRREALQEEAILADDLAEVYNIPLDQADDLLADPSSGLPADLAYIYEPERLGDDEEPF